MRGKRAKGGVQLGKSRANGVRVGRKGTSNGRVIFSAREPFRPRPRGANRHLKDAKLVVILRMNFIMHEYSFSFISLKKRKASGRTR